MSVSLSGGDNFEPMQVDNEENDNDEGAGMGGPDVRMVHQAEHILGPIIGGPVAGANGGPIIGGVAAANGGPGVMRGGAGVIGGAVLPRGDLHGEDVHLFYNIENPSIDLETYAQGIFLQNIYEEANIKT